MIGLERAMHDGQANLSLNVKLYRCNLMYAIIIKLLESSVIGKQIALTRLVSVSSSVATTSLVG